MIPATTMFGLILFSASATAHGGKQSTFPPLQDIQRELGLAQNNPDMKRQGRRLNKSNGTRRFDCLMHLSGALTAVGAVLCVAFSATPGTDVHLWGNLKGFPIATIVLAVLGVALLIRKRMVHKKWC